MRGESEWAGCYAGFCPDDPLFRFSPSTAIYLRCTLPHTSSGLPGSWASSPWHFLFDLAPGEVYPADPITRAAGGLLHHRFTLTASSDREDRVMRRSAFCCTFSRVAPGGCYPPPCSVEPGRSSASLTLPKDYQERRDRLADPFTLRILRQLGLAAQTRFWSHHSPDSAVRTRIALLSGHRSTSSGAAARIASMSFSLNLTPLAVEVPPRSSEAPAP